MAATGGTFRVAVLMRSETEAVKAVLGHDFMDCLLDYYPVGSLPEIRDSFLQLKDRYDGILTTGLFSDRMIAFYNDAGIPHRYMSASVENYYRQILLQLMHNPGLELSQIRLDLMEREHNLRSIIESDTLGTLMNEEHARVYKMTPAEVMAFEQEMVARHEWAILSGGYRLYMTRSPIAGEIFKKHNVEFLHVELTPGEITDCFKSLRRDMVMKRLQGGQIACVCLQPLSAGPSVLRRMRDGLEEYREGRLPHHVEWKERENGLWTLTDARTIDEITHGRKYSSLSGFFRNRGISLLVGYGIGNTAQEAEDNAAAAVHYRRSAPAEADWVYLVDENGQVNSLETDFPGENSSPEGSEPTGRPAGVMEAAVNRIAHTAHLSSRTVMNLMVALQRENRREAGSEWLIREMDLSPRMANKILSNLEKAGYAEVSGRTMQVSKGRPTNIYRFRFDME